MDGSGGGGELVLLLGTSSWREFEGKEELSGWKGKFLFEARFCIRRE